MNHILEDSRSPTQQPDSPKLDWNRKVKAFQCREFAVLVVYWICYSDWDGRMRIEILNCRVVHYDADLGQPSDAVLNEIVRDLICDYYSEPKIIFE